MKLREIAHALRGIVGRGVVTASSDGGESQTVDAKAYAGIDRAGVEVIQPFGVSSRSPAGGVVILLAVGADQGDLVALPVGSPGLRMGGLEEGETVIYNAKGDRVHLKKDGAIHAVSSKSVTAEIKGAAFVELDEQKVRGRIGEGENATRVAIKADLAKLRVGAQFICVTPSGLVSSSPVVVGADPDPSL